MSIEFYVVDAFTDQPFRGNPAAVCLMTETKPDRWLQLVAAEMNLSETAFVWENGNEFDLRWFTPKLEVDLCGHATLATAHILWQSGWLQRNQVALFNSRSGKLLATHSDENIFLDFPAGPVKKTQPSTELIEALRVAPLFVGRNHDDILVEVATENEVRDAQVDLQKLSGIDARGIILTAASGTDEFDFISRFFAPAVGIPEDPVTGSAHCSLAPYWSTKLGKTKLTAYQASQRGGKLQLEVVGDRIQIGGTAILISKGELLV